MAIPHTIETIELSNGLRGLLIDAPTTPVIAYAIHFRSGPDKATRAFPYQIAHTLEHLVQAGPNELKYGTKSQYLREIQKNGAWCNAYTTEFGVSYVGDSVPEEILRILKLRLSAAENPKFTQTILQSESGNVMEEMRQRVADYTRLATAMSRKILSNDEWLTSKEAIADAKNVTLEDVLAYYKNTHTTDNMKFVIAGNIHAIKESIVELFSASKLPRGNTLPGPATKPVTTDTYRYETRSSLENIFTNFTMALPRQLNAKETATMHIINNLLCNAWDSRILGQAREAGLCYSMHGHIEITKTQTIWSLDTPISHKNTQPFFTLMSSALKSVGAGEIQESELQNAKAFRIGQAKKNGQTAQDLLDLYCEDYFGLDTITTAEERIKLLESVTSQDVADLVSEFSQSTSRAFGGVGSIEDGEFQDIHTSLINELLD